MTTVGLGREAETGGPGAGDAGQGAEAEREAVPGIGQYYIFCLFMPFQCLIRIRHLVRSYR
jgi:hypothetical protein